MDLIPHSVFGRLRLAEFAPAGREVVEFGEWEFMDDRWVGEGLGAFTEFLRLEEDPEVVRAVALDLTDLPPAIGAAILSVLGLPLRPGMGVVDVTAMLGEPERVLAFVPGRTSYEFTCGARDRYAVSCTVHEAHGLVYVTVLARTPRRLAPEHLEAEA